jgi:hypothetical protein
MFVLLGLGGLFMSACGGFFLFADLASGGGRMGFWVIALPVMLVGLGCIWGAIALIRRVGRNTGEPPAQR